MAALTCTAGGKQLLASCLIGPGWEKEAATRALDEGTAGTRTFLSVFGKCWYVRLWRKVPFVLGR